MSHTQLRLWLLIVACLGGCYLPNVLAAETPALSSLTYKVVTAAQELIDSGKPVQAVKKIRPLLKKINDRPYDQAVTYQTLGYAFYAADDVNNAKAAFIKALSYDALPKEVQQKLQFNVTKILVISDDYKRAKTYLEKWLSGKPPMNSEGHLLAALVYYNLQQYKSMVPHLKQAIRLSKRPPSNWHELLAAAYVELKQFNDAANAYQYLIEAEPGNKQHWLQLATIYQLANQGKKALAITELAYKKGMLSSKQIAQLANNYLYYEMPYKSAQLLEAAFNQGALDRSIENIELLANSWILAQEEAKAIGVLEEVLKSTDNGDLSFRLGQLYYETDQWQKAVATLKKVIADKQSPQHANALMITGISAYELGDMALSTKCFNQALAYTATRNNARQWLQQLKQKQSVKG